MIKIIQQNKWFYLPWLFLSLFALVNVAITGKGDFSLWLNLHHGAQGDFFFRYITWFGDGIFVGLICLILLFIQYRIAFAAILASVINLFVTGGLKSLFNYPRPSLFFENMELSFVTGVKMYAHHSFPSGHTSAAFCIFLVLTIFSRKKIYGLFYFLLAGFVAVSRVYLFQHFLEDVLFGALIGVSIATLCSYFIRRKPLQPGSKWGRSFIRNY